MSHLTCVIHLKIRLLTFYDFLVFLYICNKRSLLALISFWNLSLKRFCLLCLLNNQAFSIVTDATATSVMKNVGYIVPFLKNNICYPHYTLKVSFRHHLWSNNYSNVPFVNEKTKKVLSFFYDSAWLKES